MNKRKPYVLISFLLIISLNTFSIESYTPEQADVFRENWRWHHLQEIDNDGIRDISQDEEGNIWFASEDGVFKYDGYDFHLYEIYGTIDTNHVNCIISSKVGLFAANSYELFTYQDKVWTPIFKDAKQNFKILKIKELADGNIYCLTNEGFLSIDKEKHITIYTYAALRSSRTEEYGSSIEWKTIPDALQYQGSHSFTDIILDKTGWYWLCQNIGDYGRIIKFNGYDKNLEFPQQYQILSAKNGYQLGREQQMLYTKKGTIWVINGHFKIGINCFSSNHHKYFKLGELYGGDDYLWSIKELSDGKIIIGGLGKMFLYDNDSWQLYKSKDVPIPPSCRVMVYQLKNDNLIIGGLQNQFYFLDYSIKTWQTYPDLNYQFEKDGQKWFLSKEGEVIVNAEEQWYSYSQADGLISDPVKLLCTSKGQIWAAGSHNSTAASNRFNGKTWERFMHPTLSWGIDYRAVFEDKSEALWFGCAVDIQPDKGQKAGVIKIPYPNDSTVVWEHFTSKQGISTHNAYGIGQSKDGKIWLGGNYLQYFDQQHWHRLDHPSKLNDYINDIENSVGSNLWVGSRYYGVFKYDGKSWNNFDIKSGLSSNTIISIYVESDSSVWIATDKDIAYYNGSNWAVDLFPEEMNMSMEGGSLLMDKQGSLWINKSSREWKRRAFPFNQSNNEEKETFNSYRYTPDSGIPETYIKDYVHKVTFNSPVTFFWSGKDLFKKTSDSDLKYSFRLNNKEWSEFSNKLNTTFYKLKPGKYTFEVRTRDMDRNIDASPAKATFEVLYPIWRQNWFIFSIIIIILIILFFTRQIIKRDQILHEKNNELNKVNEKLNIQKEEINKQNEQLNEMLVKNKELSQSKLRFFTNISHEFRTPLTLILGYIDSLIDNKIERNKKLETYKIIQRNSFRLFQLINQILEFRKIETGNLKIKLQRGYFGEFICELGELFTPLAAKRDINFEIENKTTSQIVLFDYDKLEKITFNLLSNAFKYSSSEGTIKLIIQDCNYKERKAYKITVSDTGQGIDQEHLKHLFERFYSEDNETILMKGFESTGIGLSFTKNTIELLGGEINVESEVGVGTSFTSIIPVDLPRPDTEDQPQEYKVSDAIKQTLVRVKENLSNEIKGDVKWDELSRQNPKAFDKELRNILIVEDNENMRDFIALCIHQEYNIVEAENGYKALEMMNDYDFDLIISDIMMPQMNGIEFCKKVKSNINTSHIPIILLTAKSLDENIIEGYSNQADDYIIKPFNANLLLTRIKNIIDNREAIKSKFSNDLNFEPKDIKLPSMDKEFLCKLQKIIEENMADSSFSIEIMSQMMAISRTHFIRKVKKLTNAKPLDLLISYRLKMASQLLQQKKASISEVAYMVGYDNPSSFSRAFKNKFGLSPSKFIDEIE